MSISSHIALVPTAAWPLGAGLLVTSSIFFGNVGLSLAGPIPIVKEEIGSSQLKKKDKVRVWNLFFDSAAKYIVGGTILTTTLHLGTAAIAPSSLTRNLAVSSAISSISIIPYTMFALMSTNQALKELDKKSELTAAEEGKVTQLLYQWDQRHKVRYLGYGLGWASGLAALFGVALGW